jgi:hypothetical protein
LKIMELDMLVLLLKKSEIIFKGHISIDPFLALTEQVEVGTIDDGDLHCGDVKRH